MDQDLVAKIVELTGAEEEKVAEFLDTMTLDQIYTLIDSNRKGDDATMMTILEPLKNQEETQAADAESTDAAEEPAEVEEAMKDTDKNKIKIDIPKPRDPMARELAKGQYQPKVTPNKKEKLARMDRKHKGRLDDSFSPEGLSEEAMLEEGVLGMSAMPAIKKMLTLAGRPAEDEDIMKAMEDFMGDFGDLSGLSINDIATPVGTSIPAGPLDQAMADVPADAHDHDDFDLEMGTMTPQVDGEDFTGAAYDAVRQAGETIKQALGDLTIREFAETRQLISEIQSMLDKLADTTKGRVNEGFGPSRVYFGDYQQWVNAALALGLDSADAEFVRTAHRSQDINLSKNGVVVAKWNPKSYEGWTVAPR